MPPERNNTIRFTQLSALSLAGPNDVIPIVDTSIPTLVNKKITISNLNQSLPVGLDMANIKSVSSNWDSVYASFNSNSAEYESTFSNIISNSSNWNSVYTSVNQNSAGWTGLTTYSTVNSLSDTWNTAYSLASSAYTSLSALSSGTWVLKGGDEMTGALTTTRTNTASFGLDEFVTKRYADALATATQISGNFVPGLYYTKADFQTGIPIVSAALLQFNQATMGAPGTLWSGGITFNTNQFGTDVPGFVFSTANASLGNRAGIYIDGGNSGQFSFSQGAIGHNWNGPNFATVYNLTRAGSQRLSIYDDVNLGSNLFIRGNNLGHNLVFDQWKTVNVVPKWNNVATTFTGFTVSAVDVASSSTSLLLDLQTNGSPKFSVGKDGFIYFNGKYNTQAAVIGYFSSGGDNIVFKTDGLPTHNKFVMGPTENVGYFGTGAPNFIGWMGTNDPAISIPDTRLYRDELGVIALRRGTSYTHALRIYNTFTDSGNFERLSLSGSRIAFEYAGTGSSSFDSSIRKGAYGGIAYYLGNTWMGMFPGETGDFHINSTKEIKWGTGEQWWSFDLSLARDEADRLALRRSTNNQAFRIYNTYTNANNYERLSLSATRIAYEYAGTGVARDLTIATSGNLILSGYGIFFNTTTPYNFGTAALSAESIQVNVPSNTIASSFTVVSAGRTLFSVNSSETKRVNILGNLQLDRETYDYPPRLKLQNNNNESHGEIYMANGQLNIDSFNNGFLLPGMIVIDPTNKGANFDTLVTLKGRSTNTQSFIKCLSSNGTTVFEVNSAGSFSSSSFTFLAPTDSLGTVRVTNDTSGVLRPGIYSTGNGISLATYGNGGLSNIGSAFIQHLLARRSVFSASSPAVGSGNYEETIPNIALKVGGNIGFTDASLDGSSFVRPLSATMGYDWSTGLIALSSRGVNVNSGFYFYPTGTSFAWPASIYIDSSSNLNLNAIFGAGKAIRFTDGTNVPFSVAFPSNGIITTGDAIFNAYSSTTLNVTINQGATQTNTTLFRILSSNSTAIVSVSSDGISRFNNNVFVKPNGLIQFTNTSSTTPAIKGTSTTVQARTGDDSQYTYLQGKLQTDQAASAGTFTPDKYIILYDSTGTAYKVPVQAL